MFVYFTQKQTKSYRKPIHPKVAEMEQKYPRVRYGEKEIL